METKRAKAVMLPTEVNPCIKTVGWWIFKYKAVIHTMRIKYIYKFMMSSDSYHVVSECKLCGVTKDEAFVEKDKLILWGIPVKDIENIGTSSYHVKQQLD